MQPSRSSNLAGLLAFVMIAGVSIALFYAAFQLFFWLSGFIPSIPFTILIGATVTGIGALLKTAVERQLDRAGKLQTSHLERCQQAYEELLSFCTRLVNEVERRDVTSSQRTAKELSACIEQHRVLLLSAASDKVLVSVEGLYSTLKNSNATEEEQVNSWSNAALTFMLVIRKELGHRNQKVSPQVLINLLASPSDTGNEQASQKTHQASDPRRVA